MSKDQDSSSQRFHDREQREKDYKKQLPGEDDEPLPPPVEPIKADGTPDRNDPCSCGSGKKFKKCCGKSGG